MKNIGIKLAFFLLIIASSKTIKSQSIDWDFNQEFLTYGINISKTSNLYQFGGDICVLKLDSKPGINWIGLYGDYVYNKKYDRISFGPKVGYYIVGADVALFQNLSDKDHGFQMRVQLSFVFFHPYIRFGKSFNSGKFTEFGILIKFLSKLNKKNY